jgi:hypothetical protein
MEESKTEKTSAWLKTPYANLIRYQSSGKYFARLRIKGKLIVRSLKTNAITVAKLRLADLEKEERQKVENLVSAIDGTMTFGDALVSYQQWLAGDISLKPRSKQYRAERIAALLKSWPELKDTDVRKITMAVHECQNAINSVCKKLGLVRFTHHDLRHLFATRCIESGVVIPTHPVWCKSHFSFSPPSPCHCERRR